MIQQYESKRRDAERRQADAKKLAESYFKSLEAAGLERMTPEQEEMSERLLAKARDAKEAIGQADGAIKALREAEAEDAEADKLSRETHSTGVALPGGAHTVEPGKVAGNLYGAPVASDSAAWRYSDSGRPAAVERGQKFAEHAEARAYAQRQAEQDRLIAGTHGGLAQQIRSLSTSGASALVPTQWRFPIIDKVRNAAVMFQAGATLVPMPAKVVQIGRLNTDVTAAFKTEGSAITASDPAFDFVQLTATSLTALTVASIEFLQDAPNADQVVSDAIAAVMALELDKAAFFGQLGATGTNDEGAAFGLASPYPKGILKNLLDNASGQVLGFATNGTAQTAATPWNEVLAAYYQVKTQNEVPGVFVSSDKLVQQYAGMYDTTNQPLRRPEILNTIPWLTTNTIPSFTRGTMASRATDLFTGDFSQVLIGQRMDLNVRVLTERYSELGQVGILAYWRGDVQVARPKALACYRALQGA